MKTEKVEEQGQMLSSWKEIAAYLGRTIRTCQRRHGRPAALTGSLRSAGVPVPRS